MHVYPVRKAMAAKAGHLMLGLRFPAARVAGVVLAAGTVLPSMLTSAPVQAITVFDPSNYSQNLLTAARNWMPRASPISVSICCSVWRIA